MDKTAFFKSVLLDLKLPVNGRNVDFLLKWSNAEKRAPGKFHGFNPLNTTWDKKAKDPGQTVFNSHGVKSYSSFNTGVEATADTLKLPHYKNIFNYLKTGNANPVLIVKELQKWGTHNFKPVLQYREEIPVIVILIFILSLLYVYNRPVPYLK